MQGRPPQSVQYKSPEGVEYRSLADTDAVKTARAAHDADPKNIAKIIDLGVAQSGARQFREAIATFTRGLEIEPNNALLLRWRGHRYLSVREFDRAFADLSRGSTIDPTIYGNWYHLGIVQFLRGDFAAAAASFAKAQPIAPDPGELAGSTDWLWMSLSRAGRGAEAKAMLDRMPDRRADFKPVINAYTRRLQLYRGEIGPEAVVTCGGYRRSADRHARLRPWQLVPRARRQGAGAHVVRAIGPGVGRLARIRIHRVGGGAPAAALRCRIFTQPAIRPRRPCDRARGQAFRPRARHSMPSMHVMMADGMTTTRTPLTR